MGVEPGHYSPQAQAFTSKPTPWGLIKGTTALINKQLAKHSKEVRVQTQICMPINIEENETPAAAITKSITSPITKSITSPQEGKWHILPSLYWFLKTKNVNHTSF